MPSTEFDAIITQNRNAVVIDGTDGGHITLDVPDTSIVGLAALITARNKQLRVLITWDDKVSVEGAEDEDRV